MASGIIVSWMMWFVHLIRCSVNTLVGWLFAFSGWLWNFQAICPEDNNKQPERRRILDLDYLTQQRRLSLGVSVLDMKTSSPSTAVLPELKTTHRHTVLLPDNDGHFEDYREKSAEQEIDCIQMPFDANQHTETMSDKWLVICNALRKRIRNFEDLKTAIWNCSGNYPDLDGLKDFFQTSLNKTQNDDFFHCVLPKMAELALNITKLCGQSIPVLRRGSPHSVTMSQEQAACLLANAFFCTFPESNRNHGQSDIPGLNFARLFCSNIQQSRREKLKCLYHYFKTVTENMPQGKITYSRHVVESRNLPVWDARQELFPQLRVSAGGTIEDDGFMMLQVDFANKYIGGGALGNGCVQEEIRFVICPELLVSLLFTEVLEPNEAVVITGPERFSKYTGYARSFAWGGNYIDNTPRDSWGRRCTQVVAIDAINVKGNINSQFTSQHMKRELNKAYVGFYDPDNQGTKTPVATGNWGCGAFGGDGRLKALIQLMAAAVAGRDVCYFTYHDDALAQDIYDIHNLITERSLTVGDVWKLISNYQPSSPFGRRQNVFEHIQEQVKSFSSSTPCRPHLATTDQHKIWISDADRKTKESSDNKDTWDQTSGVKRTTVEDAKFDYGNDVMGDW